MIEIEKLQNITTFQGNAPFEEASTIPTNGEDGSGDPVSPTEKEKPNYDDFIDDEAVFRKVLDRELSLLK